MGKHLSEYEIEEQRIIRRDQRHELIELRTQLTEAKADCTRYKKLYEEVEEKEDYLLKSNIERGRERDDLYAEVERLKERCASDPWWWAYSEYLDEGWVGPFETREQAEASADDHLGPVRPDDDPPRCADDERPEVSYRQASNPEGCAENERLQADLEQLRGAAEPFLSLQSPDHSERIAGLIHRTYFDKLAAALAQPEPAEKTDGE